MKKLLTLVLALVLVFAIAAPALAITGDLEDPTPDATEVEFVELDLALLAKMPAPTAFGGFQLSQVAANKAYIVNELAFYGVAVYFPELEDGEEVANMPKVDYWDSDLIISSDAIDLADLDEGYVVDENGAVAPLAGTLHVNADNELILEDVPDGAWFSGDTYYLFGQGVVAAKGVLTVELKKDAVDLDVAPFSIYNKTKLLYTVQKSGLNYFVTDADGNYVEFSVNADKEVTYIGVSLDAGAHFNEVKYYVPISGGGSVVQAIGTLEDEDFDEALACYKAVMSFFGFNYDAEGLLKDKHFECKASGLYLKDEAAIQLYTAAIVVPGGVEPPKTGDASTVIGFVMIALAMIAAGVVVSRKVRA